MLPIYRPSRVSRLRANAFSDACTRIRARAERAQTMAILVVSTGPWLSHVMDTVRLAIHSRCSLRFAVAPSTLGVVRGAPYHLATRGPRRPLSIGLEGNGAAHRSAPSRQPRKGPTLRRTPSSPAPGPARGRWRRAGRGSPRRARRRPPRSRASGTGRYTRRRRSPRGLRARRSKAP